MQIDSHHHLWHYTPTDYPWISAEKHAIARHFLADDLKTVIDNAGIDGTVAVQARQTLEETRWLLKLANTCSFIQGVVGWVPLINTGIDQVLAEFAGETKLKAVRHVLQDEPDDRFMLHDDFQRGVSALAKHELAYDILIYARHLANVIAFVDNHPDQSFVLDHIAKPTIIGARFDQEWADRINELALRDNVVCKLSGIATEVRDLDWSVELIKPYFDTVLGAFGPSRLMFGTDWPVCLLRTSYGRWVDMVRDLIADLSPDEQAQIMGLTAARIYRL